MKKGLIVLASIVMIFAVAVYFFIFKEDYVQHQVRVEQQIVSAVEKKRQTNERALIDFTQIAPFAWDNVYIFTPYTSSKMISKQLGFKWNHKVVSTIETHDHIDLLVFVQNKEVTGYVEHARSNGDFEIHNQMGFSRDEAIFEVVKGKDGEPDSFIIRNVR
ncbi:hypothetical protein ACQCN2_20815 [Brevibacillus ginsengisoli]|uniref:hypothetical protein n=1 Tax=Brevibacillus ginsengisoli TaxID=363854 RepID=UPI003CF1F39D